MQFRELLHERKPNPSSFVGAAARAFDPVKAIEQSRQFVLRNADTGVLDPEYGTTLMIPYLHGDAAFKGELECIGNKVENDFLPHVPVDPHRRGKGRTIDNQLKPGLLSRGTELAGQFGRKR